LPRFGGIGERDRAFYTCDEGSWMVGSESDGADLDSEGKEEEKERRKRR